MLLADRDRWRRLFGWFALVAVGFAACALAVAVADPREGGLPPGAGFVNASELLNTLVYGSAAVALIAVLIWRLRRSLAWSGDRTAAAVQMALLLPAVVGAFWAFWAGMHELFASGYPLNEDLLTINAWRVGGTLFGLMGGVGLSLVLLGGLGLVRLLVRDRCRRARIRRWSRVARCAVLLLPFGWSGATVVAQSTPLRVLSCVGTTGVAFLGLHLMQRHRRLPAWVLAGAFGWGVWVAFGFAGLVNNGYLFFAPPVLRHAELMAAALNLTPAIFEEAAKGAGIALLCLLAGRRFSGVVPGLVIGAATGLGFNFVESVEYMSQGAAFQFWIRQVVGIGGAHVAFSALVGAGIGLAYGGQAPRRVVVYGYVTALCAHFLSNYGMGRVTGWIDAAENPYLWVLVVSPGGLVVLQGPFVVMYVLALRRGLRAEAEELAAGVRAESWAGHGAIASADVPVLCSPRQRRLAAVQALRRGGVAGWRQEARLRRAQTDLAMRARARHGPADPVISTLRDRIEWMKRQTASRTPADVVPVGAGR